MKRLMLIVVFGSLASGLLGQAQQTENTAQDDARLESMVERHFALMGEFGDEEALQASLKQLVAVGPRVVRIVREAYNHWSRQETADPTTGTRPGEMRWRAIHLLGSLGQTEAVPALFDVARTPLPDPRRSEQMFADEYRIRLRAVAGLERLKAVDELKELYEIGGVLRNPTAASLYALGTNVGQVRRVDVKTALAEDTADSKDYNRGKGRVAQPDKPGSAKASIKRRPDTPAIKREN